MITLRTSLKAASTAGRSVGIGAAFLLVFSLGAAAAQDRLDGGSGTAASFSRRPPIPLGLDLLLPAPGDNPMSHEVVRLGRDLFLETALSLDGDTACASCHLPERAFSDGRMLPEGAFGAVGTRNAPTLVNRAYGRLFFLDGRVASLEEQALHPIDHAGELGLGADVAVARLGRDPDYAARFRVAFGRAVNRDDLARALAGYVRTILSGDAPFDRHAAGHSDALDAQQRLGLELFRGRANCDSCHVGPNFSDEAFHNTGVAWRPDVDGTEFVARNAASRVTGPGAFADVGRFAITGVDRDLGAFKTPTLREIARTAPYMHDGSLATLEEVVDFYERGGNANPGLDRQIMPLNLSEADKAAIVSFLRSLSGIVQDGTRGTPVGSGR